jgi:hypothetical protein
MSYGTSNVNQFRQVGTFNHLVGAGEQRGRHGEPELVSVSRCNGSSVILIARSQSAAFSHGST